MSKGNNSKMLNDNDLENVAGGYSRTNVENIDTITLTSVEELKALEQSTNFYFDDTQGCWMNRITNEAATPKEISGYLDETLYNEQR